MRTYTHMIRIGVQTVVALLAGSLISTGVSAETADEYPDPRFPRFLVEPSEEQMMDAARIAVRQTHGFCPLGTAESGQTVHVFLSYDQDMEVWNVIKKAWAERGVTAVGVRGWEAIGMTREDYEKRAKANLLTGADGWKEYGVFDPAYAKFFPLEIQESFGKPLTVLYQYVEQQGFMDDHPEIEHVYVGSGGGRGHWERRVGKEHGHKWRGNWLYYNKSDLMNKSRAFPSDVWKMVDEHIVRPIPHVAEGTFYDPQGTRLHWTMTPQQSQVWEKKSGLSSYSSGHLQIYPDPQHSTLEEGVVVAGANHTAFYPSMTVHLNEHGKVIKVDGGGKAGEMFRILLEHPKFKNAHFPSESEPGYWYLTQDGLGTNPKQVRNMERLANGSIDMPNLNERIRAGVQHLSFSHALSRVLPLDQQDPRDLLYAVERGIPLKHTGHMHVYFPTVKWKLRDTGEWITIVDKGRLKALDNPEVRALAAKYGDPDEIFSYDWIPAIPGINVAGDYQTDYAQDPWSWISSVWGRIKNGSYEHYVEDYDMLRDEFVSASH